MSLNRYNYTLQYRVILLNWIGIIYLYVVCKFITILIMLRNPLNSYSADSKSFEWKLAGLWTEKLSTPLDWLQANRVDFRGWQSSQAPLTLLGARRVGSELLHPKKLSIPLDLLGVSWKTSEILTNQKAAKEVQRLFSHSICLESIFQLGRGPEVTFPDYWDWE